MVKKRVKKKNRAVSEDKDEEKSRNERSPSEDSSGSVSEVLNEIAQFMVMVYDHYIQGLVGPDVLGGLLAFLSDLGFLTNRSISILEAENLRVKNLSGGEVFEYEHFYGWLRDIAGLVYRDDKQGGRKAMHRLLTTNMIPVASRNAQLDEKRARTYIEFTDMQQLEVLCLCEDFMRLWYCSVVSDTDLFMVSASRFWAMVRADDLHMTLVQCLEELTTVHLCPHIVSAKQVSTFVDFLGQMRLSNVSGVGRREGGARYLTFTDFILVLMFIAKIGQAKLALGTDLSTRGSLVVVIQTVAEHYLTRLLSGVRRSSEDASSKLMWMCRQAGLCTLRASDGSSTSTLASRLLDAVSAAMTGRDSSVSYRATTSTGVGAFVPPPSTMALLKALVSLVESMLAIPLAGVNRILIYSAHERTEASVMALYLTLTAPSILFSRGSPPNNLAPMYSTQGLAILQHKDVVRTMETIWAVCSAFEDSEPEPDTDGSVVRRRVVSRKNMLGLCAKHGLGLLSDTTALNQAFNYVLDVSPASSGFQSGRGEALTFVQWQELLFVLVHERSAYGGGVGLEGFLRILDTLCPGAQLELSILYAHSAKSPGGKKGPALLDAVEVAIASAEAVEGLSVQTRGLSVRTTHTCGIEGGAGPEKVRPVDKEVEGLGLGLVETQVTQPGPVRDTLLLLMHFPISSRRFTPWAVVKLFAEARTVLLGEWKKGAGGSHSDPDVSKLMAEILRQFTSRLELKPEKVSDYLQGLTWEGTRFVDKTADDVQLRRQRVQNFLSSPFFSYLISQPVLSLLRANEELLLWEYMACSRLNRLSNPFTLNTVVPLPCVTPSLDIPEGLFLCSQALSAWAMRCMGLDQEVAVAMVRHIQSVFPDDITFSGFVIFTVLVFTGGLFKGGRLPTKQDFLHRVKVMLQRFSDDVTGIQQSLQVRIMSVLCGGRDIKSQRRVLSSGECKKLLENSVRLFDAERDTFVPAQRGGLAPRPPYLLWDAPRFLEFAKFFGILEQTRMSLSAAWRNFGSEVSSMSAHGGWADGVVGPGPLSFSIDLVERLLRRLLSAGAGACASVEELCSGAVLPIAVSALHSKIIDPATRDLMNSIDEDKGNHSVGTADGGSAASAGVLGSYNHIALEDITRLGGHRVFVALESNLDFVEALYRESMPDPGANQSQSSVDEGVFDAEREPSLTQVCQSLCIDKVLSLGVVCLLAKQSLHSRARLNFEHVAMNRNEFHELIMRCALHLWFASGGVVKGTTVEDTHVDASWGVDFLTPYVDLLRRQATTKILQRTIEVKNECVGGVSSTGSAAEHDRGALRGGNDAAAMDPVATSPRAASPMASCVRSSSLEHSLYVSDGRSSPLAFALGPRLGGGGDSAVGPAVWSPGSPLGDTDFEDDGMFTPVVKSLVEIGKMLQESDSGLLGREARSPRKSEDNMTITSITRRQSFSADTIVMDNLKELLWSVHATFCSCGDSLNPGKISGPNLFTLLSKLGVLSDETCLSDVGILLHQISVRSPTSAPVAPLTSVTLDLPALSYEDLLVYLCAFAQLLYLGEVTVPMGGDAGDGSDVPGDFDLSHYIHGDQCMRHLMEDSVKPVLTKHPLLAMPEDARNRDRHVCLFSLDMLFALQSIEATMRKTFIRLRTRTPDTPAGQFDFDFSVLHLALVLSEAPRSKEWLLGVIQDSSSYRTGTLDQQNMLCRRVAFPHFQWVLYVCALEATHWLDSDGALNMTTIKEVAGRTTEIAMLLLSHM